MEELKIRPGYEKSDYALWSIRVREAINAEGLDMVLVSTTTASR